jgi:pullulanase/glycogen debranching enzyme
MLDFFRQAIALRHAHPALRGGRFHQVYAQDRQYAFVRRDETETLLVALNGSDNSAQVRVPVAEYLEDRTALRPLFGDLSASVVCDGHVMVKLPARSGAVWGR